MAKLFDLMKTLFQYTYNFLKQCFRFNVHLFNSKTPTIMIFVLNKFEQATQTAYKYYPASK